MRRAPLILLPLAGAACIDAAQDEVRIPLALAGRSEAASFETPHGHRVALQSAELAFGPLYLCAGASAGRLCETALLEWDDAARVDVLSDETQRVGALRGLTGRVSSWMYDLGLVSLLTQPEPLVLEAARALDGHSVRLRGAVTVGEVTIPFRADLSIQQSDQTESGTQVIRSRQGDDLAHEVTQGDALTVRFDARQWFQTANFDLWLEDATCGPGGRAVVCAGQTEQTCAEDGSLVSERECAESSRVCVAARGCVAEVEVDPQSQVGAALRIDVTSASTPQFSWTKP